MDNFSEKNHLLKLAKAKMPFGKYKDRHLVDIPEEYLIWAFKKNIAKGELEKALKEIYEIKLNGLEYLLRPLINK